MANESRTWLSRSPEATESLGEALGQVLPDRTLVALIGDLGAGKTCFARGLARGLDVADPLSSPTYALLQSYAGRHELHHLDAWMEGRERAFLVDGGLEWLQSSGVTLIEWADRVADVLPTPRLVVTLAHAGPTERRITIAVEGDANAANALSAVLRTLAGGRDLAEVVASRKEH